MTAPAPTPTTTAQVMGPGVLTFGETTGVFDASAQVTKAAVKWKGKSGDALVTLSGGTLAGDREYTVTLDATLLQDLTAGTGLVAWTWANRGKEVPFTFTPTTSVGSSINGRVIVDPLDVGGDVNKKNTSDISWEVVGTPTFGADLT